MKVIKEAHLSTKTEVTLQEGSKVHPLKMALPPYHGTREDLNNIIDFLDVENSPRYQPTSSETYCDTYAYDYCNACHAYLPAGVWWKNPKEVTEKTKAIYNKNVKEMNVNMLYEWFDDYGKMYGWKEVDMGSAQLFANDGFCVVGLAANKNPARSGHIVAVIPTPKNTPHVHKTSVPWQSQAGRTNRKRFNKIWWNNMKPIKFYVNETVTIRG